MPRCSRRLLGPALHGGLAIVVLAVAVVSFRRYEEGFDLALDSFVLAFPLFVVQLGALLLAWWVLLRDASPLRPGLRLTTSSFVVGWLSRYVPGPPTGPVGKFVVAKNGGVPGAAVGSALAHEQILQLCAVVLVPAFTIGFFFGFAWFSWTAPLAIIMSVLAFRAIHSGRVSWLMTALLRKALRGKASTDIALLPPRTFLPTALLVGATVASGLSFHIIATRLGSVEGAQVGLSVFIFGIASLAGYLAPFAPAGAGVREAVIIGLLAPIAGPGEATTVAVATRAMAIAFDGLLAAGLLCVYVARGVSAAFPLLFGRFTSSSNKQA